MSEQHHHPKLAESAVALATVRSEERGRLVGVLAITALVMGGELAGGILTHSLALLNDEVGHDTGVQVPGAGVVQVVQRDVEQGRVHVRTDAGRACPDHPLIFQISSMPVPVSAEQVSTLGFQPEAGVG